MDVKEYFKHIQQKVQEHYAAAREARKKGIDPVADVEVPVASSMAEKAVGLISTVYPQLNDKIVKRILELEGKYGSLDPCIALTIAEEIARERFCKFESIIQAIEAGIRVAVSYMTLGVVSSPIEGFVELKIGKTRDGNTYFKPYYAGPIRSAGGTEMAFSLVVIDYLRELFGFAKYDVGETEIKRGVHESYMYHERVTNLQYLPSEAEIEMLMKNLPIQVAGDPSAEIEVYNYKDLDRVETNFIRSGFALVINEGIAQKAPKILKRIKKLREKGFKLSDWNWLEEFVSFQKKLKEGKSNAEGSGAVYIKDMVAGRPVFGHPSRSGCFRLRYGRCRNTGYSTLGTHPSTMFVSGGFIAIGTQLKIEKPTKGCTVASCDSVDAPIVKFRNGSVKQLWDCEEAKKRYNDIVEILYFGDLLIPYGDFFNRNHKLDKPGYVEQYWLEQLREKGGENELFVSFEDAVKVSKDFGIPLHPRFIYYWKEIDYELFLGVIDWIGHGDVRDGKLVLPFGRDKERFVKGKRALELIGVEHDVTLENVVLNAEISRSFLFNLGVEHLEFFETEIDKLNERIKIFREKELLDIINLLCSISIKDKSGTFIGARMAKPEKAKLRKLTGSPHVLFPVGAEGGRLRSFQSAVERGSVSGDFPNFYCEDCNKENIYSLCECGKICGKITKEGKEFSERRIDIQEYFSKAKKLLGFRNEEIPIVKGVRGTSNKGHDCENLAKGLLRAKYNLNVNKDGTIRYDIIQMPITHFKPNEIGTSVEKLRELGYEKDVDGKKLENENQILEIFPHDIILPSCPETLDEKADDVLANICSFIDEELEKIYLQKRFFNIKAKKDLVGLFVANIAPHICTAVVGRVIGFSKTHGFLASPYMHAAMRRDCDGDEAAFIVLMDLLINFSRKFLPAHRGGTQDAPLVLGSTIRAGEVDDMIFDVDVSRVIPLSMYQSAEEQKSPYDVKMEQIRGRLGSDREFSDIFYSYETSNINLGPGCSTYKSIPSMDEKVNSVMNLSKKLRAVDVNDVARLIIERHFIRDTRGNLRKFSMQVFRCVNCNNKYRRAPLAGKCGRCGGKLIFTISEGSILKYMQKALDLAREYNVSPYLLESLELTEMYIESIFGKEKEKQEALGKWF